MLHTAYDPMSCYLSSHLLCPLAHWPSCIFHILCHIRWLSGRAASACSVRGPGFESHRGQSVLFTTAIAIYSLRHGLCTFTAVSRSTQPSTLRRTVKWVSAYELSNNNKWWWCLRMVAAYFGGLLARVGRLGLRVGGHPALSLHLSNEPGELSQWLCHDDSTINIVMVIIIIITTVLRPFVRDYPGE